MVEIPEDVNDNNNKKGTSVRQGTRCGNLVGKTIRVERSSSFIMVPEGRSKVPIK